METGSSASTYTFSKIKIFFSVFVSLIIFSFFSNSVYAVDVTITSFPSSITSGDAFQVGVNISGASDGTNYLRVDLFKEGTTNYFGETFNGAYWLNSSNGLNYYPVQVQNSTASASFLAKVGSPNLTDFPGAGTYKLRVRRYTASGDQASDSITPVTVQITYSLQTPTPTPTATPVATPTSTPTIVPTKSPTPIPVKTNTPTPKPTPTPQILGESSPPTLEPQLPSTLQTDTPEPPTQSPSQNKKTKLIVTAGLLISLGLIAMIFAGYTLYKKSKFENG